MWKRFVKEWFTFSRSERRGVMVLGAVLLLSVAVPAALRWMRPVYTSNYEQLKLRVDSLAPLVPSAKEGGKTSFERTDREARIFYFDPNTIPHDSLLMLGFSPKQASVIENYRRRGGFRTAEQFLRLYVVSNHQHLAGYIRIAQRRGAEPAAKADTPAASPALVAAPSILPIDINSADTADLKALPGIGSYLARRIVEYRRKLGGYTRLDQLCEIKYFDRDKLLRLQPRLTIDYSRVQKIPLTASGAELLRLHPYAGAYAARGIARRIEFNGGSTSLDDLVQNNILTPEQADKLRDYIME